MNEKIPLGIAVVALLVSIAAISSALVVKPELEIGIGGVSEKELQDDSVTSRKIADGTITDEDINDTGISKIADGAITMGDLSSAVTNAITGAAEIANNSITSGKIANETIATVDLANDSVTSEKIVDGEVKSLDIATGAVGSDEIESGAVDTDELATDAVTYDKMKIKTKCGLATNVVHGSRVTHNLGFVPTSLVVTPVYDPTSEGGTVVLHANVYNVSTNSFDVALWFEIEYPFPVNPLRLEKVDGDPGDPVQSADVYWIAIYSP